MGTRQPSQVGWLKKRAESAEEAEMPEKAHHYRSAATEIEFLRSENERLTRAYLRYEFDAALFHGLLREIVVWWDGKGKECWPKILEQAKELTEKPTPIHRCAAAGFVGAQVAQTAIEETPSAV